MTAVRIARLPHRVSAYLASAGSHRNRRSGAFPAYESLASWKRRHLFFDRLVLTRPALPGADVLGHFGHPRRFPESTAGKRVAGQAIGSCGCPDLLSETHRSTAREICPKRSFAGRSTSIPSRRLRQRYSAAAEFLIWNALFQVLSSSHGQIQGRFRQLRFSRFRTDLTYGRCPRKDPESCTEFAGGEPPPPRLLAWFGFSP